MARDKSRVILCTFNDLVTVELMEDASGSPSACEFGVLASRRIKVIVKPFPNFLYHIVFSSTLNCR
jgi:hypothetical protein